MFGTAGPTNVMLMLMLTLSAAAALLMCTIAWGLSHRNDGGQNDEEDGAKEKERKKRHLKNVGSDFECQVRIRRIQLLARLKSATLILVCLVMSIGSQIANVLFQQDTWPASAHEKCEFNLHLSNANQKRILHATINLKS